MTDALQMDNFWVDKNVYADAERQHYENLAKLPNSTGLISQGNSIDGSNPEQSEDLQSPKSFVAIKKISISESDSNKENNASTESPETPKSNIRKIKSQKCILSQDESEWITVCSKSELKEKSSKRNKKSKDRTREMTPTSVSNKDVSSPTSPKEDTTAAAVPPQPAAAVPPQPAAVAQPQQAAAVQPQPAVVVKPQTPVQPQPAEVSAKSPKKKDAKEKANKAEKKRANKKDKAEVKEEIKPQVIENIQEVLQVVEKALDKQGESAKIVSGQCSLSNEIAKARQHIKNSLECMDSAMASVPNVEVVNRLNTLESAMNDLRSLVLRVQNDVTTLMKHIPAAGKPAAAVCPAKPAQAKPAAKDDSDDGVDLFASDSEDDEAANKIREERLAAYAAKKSKKPALIAKSNIILDVKPWDDETDMKEMEKQVRKIEADGLLWGASKFVEIAFGITKLQISSVVEDEKVSVDWLQEEIEKIEDLVQSVDIAAFNKI